MKRFFTFAAVCSLVVLGTTQAEEQNPKKKPQTVQKNPTQVHKPVTHTTTNVHNTNVHTNTNVHNTNVHTTNLHNTNVNNKTVSNTQINKTKVVNNYQLKHTNFHAHPNTTIQSAKFNQHFHIAGSQNWHGHQYAVFQNYHPAWHDHLWYHSHYHNVILIGGGWYYWNAGYWFPAWGYDPGVAYYPYDGPIYVGANATPPDQMIADVQGALQEQGYYHGDVDGLLGPQTRAALADYQQAQGLETTAAMDEPTLQSLGMS